MAIEFEHNGKRFKADTPEEAAKLLSILDERDAVAGRERPRVEAFLEAQKKAFLSRLRPISAADENPWTPELFSVFISRLGRSQKAVLQALLLYRRLPDTDLRQKVGIESNQALAGVLSGISKQATAIGVSPRNIFWIENTRSSGKRSNRYEVADRFWNIAYDEGWPARDEIINPLPSHRRTLDNA